MQRLLSQSQMAWQALGTYLHLFSDMILLLSLLLLSVSGAIGIWVHPGWTCIMVCMSASRCRNPHSSYGTRLHHLEQYYGRSAAPYSAASERHVRSWAPGCLMLSHLAVNWPHKPLDTLQRQQRQDFRDLKESTGAELEMLGRVMLPRQPAHQPHHSQGALWAMASIGLKLG